MKKIALLLSAVMLLSAMLPMFVWSQTYDTNPFADIGQLGKNEKWFTASALWAYANGYMVGTLEDKFSPSAKMTRGQIVMILANASGDDMPEYSGAFTDVKKNNWYTQSVQWAYNCGVTSGMTETTFAPNAEVTREQLARFLAVYSEKVLVLEATPKSSSIPDKFTDKNKVSSWALNNIIWADFPLRRWHWAVLSTIWR